MSEPAFEINLNLADEKVKLNGISMSNPMQPLTFDYIPPIGTGQGFAGLELIVMSFAGCVSTAVLVLLRRSGIEITGFTAHAQGFRRDNPLSLSKIIYQAEITSPNATDEAVQSVMEHVKSISPVWQSLNPDIEVTASGKLIR